MTDNCFCFVFFQITKLQIGPLPASRLSHSRIPGLHAAIGSSAESMFEGQEGRSGFYLFASIFVFFLHLFLFEKHTLMNEADDDKKSIDKIIEGK